MMLSLLVVDDERNMLLMLNRVLSKDGYHVTTANNADQALKLIDSEIFHVAVLDIKMVPMDGVELLKEIRKRSPDTRVIMTTAYPTVESRNECIKLGASGYLVKPVEMSKLKEALCHLEIVGSAPGW